MHTGANKPVHIRGIDVSSGQKGEYVVKLRASERMGDPSAALRETVAAFIGLQLGVPVARPVQVDISDDTSLLTNDATLLQRLVASVGLNFGSVYAGPAYQVMPANASPSNELCDALLKVCCFDLLIQNTDRRFEKPNLLTNGTAVVAIDHELSLPDTRYIFGPKHIWEMKTVEHRKWIQDMFIPFKLKGRLNDVTSFCDTLNSLDVSFWTEVWAILPASWQVIDTFQGIQTHISAIATQRRLFEKELKTIFP